MHPSRRIAIRSTQPGETKRILALARDSGLFSDEEMAVVEELLQAHFSDGAEGSGYYFLVVSDAQDLLGFACYGPRPLTNGAFDLYWLAVAHDVARQGVGTALLTAVVEDVRRLGARLLIAETSGLPGYLPAREFYLRSGFRLAATIADFYAPGDDLSLFVRRL